MGKRGPKKGAVYKPTLEKAAARELARQRITNAIAPMLDAQIAHAQGIKFLVARAKAGGKFERVSTEQLDAMLQGQDDGKIILEVWDKDPNVQAFAYLLDQAIDQAPKHIALTGAGGGPIRVKWED